ncbi:hypothetical protein GCK72_011116 [Caenorhabditis remanei]|uniref:Edg1 TPR repeats region domain-containing protein n=1 Tax=Caenorhabditis remanei TaxID=31234 RepID=A0A6A5H8V7_CAERE|nr:hypothetical protein GCK72_011116 [Caenorhabditis remanei]KAF1762853.1 hypothetical protein GCK72_011116 [Caenorhabditis remanei]
MDDPMMMRALAESPPPDNSFYGLPPQEDLEVQKLWVAEVSTILEGYKVYKTDVHLIKKFLDTRYDFDVYDYYAYDLTLDAMAHFQAGITQTNMEMNKKFMLILQKLYMMFAEENKLTFHREFVKEWQYYPIDYCPYFETLLYKYSETLNLKLNAVCRAPEDIEHDVMEEIRWNLLIAPVNTLLALFKRCVDNPNVIQFTIYLCTHLPALFHDRPLKIYHNELETKRIEPLLCVVFRRFLCSLRCQENTDSQWEILYQLMMAFCDDEKKPLMSCWQLLEVVLNELYTPNRLPTKSVEMLSAMASRILSPENKMKLTFKFATSMRAPQMDCLYLTPTIIIMFLNIMDEYHENKKSIEVIDNCKSCLKSIGERMTEEHLEFDDDTKSRLMEELSKRPWYVEYAVSTWYFALNVEKRRVPTAIFQGICSEDKSPSTSTQKIPEFIEITQKSISKDELPFECLRSLMKLGLFDPECTLELLHISPATRIQLDVKDIASMMEFVMKEYFNVKLALVNYECARELMMYILEAFDKPATLDHEEIIKTIIEELPVPVIPREWPRHSAKMEKSLIIQPLEKPRRNSDDPWPPPQKFISLEMRELHAQQKRERDRLYQISVIRTEKAERIHRERWAQDDSIVGWTLDESPPNEPVFLEEKRVESSESTSTSKSSEKKKVKRVKKEEVKEAEPLTEPEPPRQYKSIAVSPERLADPVDPASLAEKLEKVEVDRFAVLRRCTPNTIFGGSAKRGGRH